MAVRMRDVARLASVSEATVSLVLSGSPRISEATRRRVTRIVDALQPSRSTYPIRTALRVTEIEWSYAGWRAAAMALAWERAKSHIPPEPSTQ